jgi:transposase
MNAVGIDVSKGKSMIAVIHPFGEVVVKPYEIRHTASELRGLAQSLKSLDGETRVILEHTGRYYEPVAQRTPRCRYFCQRGQSTADSRVWEQFTPRVKTDKADS